MNKKTFLDVLLIEDGENLNTAVYRKDKHNDLHINLAQEIIYIN